MRVQHARVVLALHAHRQGPGPVLLLLHPLGASSSWWGTMAVTWPGSVYALDFSGHGDSGTLRGGAYSPELLAADADIALARLGVAALAGAGVGAYVALLLAGARPDLVPAALLMPGPGLDGGGAAPVYDRPVGREWAASLPTDPTALLVLLDRDVRPPAYATAFAHTARHVLLVEDDTPRPPWWTTVRTSPTAERVGVSDAFTRLATLASLQPA